MELYSFFPTAANKVQGFPHYYKKRADSRDWKPLIKIIFFIMRKALSILYFLKKI